MSTEPNCFVIMPINNPATEHIWEQVFQPVISECGFTADRIDQSDDGSDMSPQILEKIVNADLIVADLTMERQNCYFELGYAYGNAKTDASVIVSCREDHYHRSESYNSHGPQVHFDLSGRSIIWWDDKNLDDFKSELRKKIELRLEQIKAHQSAPSTEVSAENLKSDLSIPVGDKNKDELEYKLKKAIHILDET